MDGTTPVSGYDLMQMCRTAIARGLGDSAMDLIDCWVIEASKEITALRAERDKLQRFKEYVHRRLDEAGVPTDPESSHKAEGCRIGGRLDIVLARHPLTEDRLEEVLKLCGDDFQPDDVDDLLKSANADPDEGAEWLPYYKLAIAIDAGTIGYLCGILDGLKRTPAPDLNRVIDTALKVARQEMAASSIVCGIGPRTDADTICRVLNAAECVKADPLHGGHGDTHPKETT